MDEEMGMGMDSDQGGMVANGGNEAAAGAGDQPQQEMAGPETEEQGDGENSIFLTPDMLPPGKEVSAGDTLTFKVKSVGDGRIEACYDGPDSEYAGKGGEGESWEDQFRKEMSARSPGNDINIPAGNASGYSA